jgi:hypothetical protein
LDKKRLWFVKNHSEYDDYFSFFGFSQQRLGLSQGLVLPQQLEFSFAGFLA